MSRKRWMCLLFFGFLLLQGCGGDSSTGTGEGGDDEQTRDRGGADGTEAGDNTTGNGDPSFSNPDSTTPGNTPIDTPVDTPDDNVPDTNVPDPGDTPVTDPPVDTPDDTPAGSVAMGGSCGCDADCGAVEGHDGICIYGICMTRAAAACAEGGSTSECPGGSSCWYLVDNTTDPLCWPSCNTFTCAGTCDETNDCVPTVETDCNTACGIFCTGGDDGPVDTPTSGSAVGGPCGTDDDCAEGTCLQQEDDNGFLSGYCYGGCDTPGAACGSTGACVADLGGEGAHICMATCDSGCRTGYDCLSFSDTTFCYPWCETGSDCGGGMACVDNTCIASLPCSASNPEGFCADDGVCNGGTCTSRCSPSSPEGFCPTGFSCDGTRCMSDSGCGTWECESNCTDLVAFGGSSDMNSAQAQADGFFINTEAKYAYLQRDLVILTRWATCEMRTRWPDIMPIAVSDLAQSNGLTPGVDEGWARHPESTHRGLDLDMSYYQTDGANDYHIICGDGSDRNGNGNPGTYNDGYFCTTNTNVVDFEKQVYFFALMSRHAGWRVVGIDVTLENGILSEAQRQYDAGLIDETAWSRLQSQYLGAGGDSWVFHHHHAHLSYGFR